jgi:TonB family protein
MELRQAQIQGTVQVRFRIKEDGFAADATAIGTPPPQLADLAVDSVLKWQFEPITRSGRPTSVWLNYDFIFRLE